MSGTNPLLSMEHLSRARVTSAKGDVCVEDVPKGDFEVSEIKPEQPAEGNRAEEQFPQQIRSGQNLLKNQCEHMIRNLSVPL